VCAKARRELRDQPRGGSVDKARAIADMWISERSAICVWYLSHKLLLRYPLLDTAFP
jgi:hypothetical protein